MCEEGLHDPFTDQVECARYRAERDALAQRMEEVASEIDRTLSGVEGIEDAPAMRWMRGLREALGSLHAPRIGCEGIEAAKWVREHGGLSHVKDIYHDLRAVVERLGIEWSESELHGLIDVLDRRLMPEGCKWPRYASGEQVQFGDAGLDVYGKRRTVEGVKFTQGGFAFISDDKGRTWWANDRGPLEDPEIDPDKRVKHPAPPVLAADGRPLREGETVWHIKTGREYVVVEPSYGKTVVVRLAKYDDAEGEQYAPDQLTHERPDSWQRLEEDADRNPFDYCKEVGHRLDTCENSEAYKALDIVRRAKALAGVSE